ncbi:MAG: hypothetical protein NC184_04690 [Roseburia sp.]|nr:hypothetical protein [Roseburia sp.]
MNAVFYCSYTGQSKRIAEYISARTGYPPIDVCDANKAVVATAFIVFPVHCQSVPRAVKDVLRALDIKRLIPIATYGKKCHGDVLRDVSKLCRGDIVAAAYVPTKHAYVAGDEEFCDFDALEPLFAALDTLKPIKIPKSYKNPLSCVFPRLRSRIGVRLYKDASCDGCGACERACAQKAVKAGKPNGRCMRCLKCVATCPKGALHFRCRFVMKKYLSKRKSVELEIFV